MKRIIIPVLILFSVLLFSCAEMAIENTISDFEGSVNIENISDIKETLSTESEMYLGDTEFQAFLDYFDIHRNVDYSSLDISIDGRDADVYSDGTYQSGTYPTKVLFWMRREEAIFAFISQDWRVYRYYDDDNFIVDLDEVWKKINTQSE